MKWSMKCKKVKCTWYEVHRYDVTGIKSLVWSDWYEVTLVWRDWYEVTSVWSDSYEVAMVWSAWYEVTILSNHEVTQKMKGRLYEVT